MNTNKLGKPNEACYASILGACGAMSGEHVISRGLFGEGMVRAQNLRVPNDKLVSIDSMTANILCRSHNEALGRLDDEIKKLSDAILAWRSSDEPVAVRLNGYLIERWFLKCLVGILFSGWLKVKVPVSETAVRAIFGLRRVGFRDALYLLGNVLVESEHEKEVEFSFLRAGEATDRGAMFMIIHGVALVFSSNLDDPQATLRSYGKLLKYDVSQANLLRHAPQVVVSGSKHSSRLTINFDWSKKLRPPML